MRKPHVFHSFPSRITGGRSITCTKYTKHTPVITISYYFLFVAHKAGKMNTAESSRPCSNKYAYRIRKPTEGLQTRNVAWLLLYDKYANTMGCDVLGHEIKQNIKTRFNWLLPATALHRTRGSRQLSERKALCDPVSCSPRPHVTSTTTRIRPNG